MDSANNIRKLKRSFVLQRDGSDCGVACLESIINYYGGLSNSEDLRNESGTTEIGTSLLGLYFAAKKNGFDVSGYQANTNLPLSIKFPAIFHFNNNHFVICYGSNVLRGKLLYIIGDPAKDLHFLSHELLLINWQTGKYLELIPNSDFKLKKKLKTQKVKRIIKLVKKDYSVLIVTILMGIGISALGLIMSVFVQKVIDEFLPKKNISKLYFEVFFVFILLIIREVLSFLRVRFLNTQSKDFGTRITDFFYNRLIDSPLSFFQNRKIGDFTSRLNDTSKIQSFLSQLAGTTLVDFVFILVSLGLISYYSFQIAIVFIIFLPIFFALVLYFVNQIRRTQRDIMEHYSKVESNFISTLNGILSIKNHRKESFFAEKNKQLYLSYQEKILDLGTIKNRIHFAIGLSNIFLLICLIIYCSNEVLKHQLRTGEMVALIGISTSLLTNTVNLALLSIPIYEANVALDRLFQFSNISTNRRVFLPLNKEFSSIRFENISCRFPGSRLILKNISLAVCKGEIISLIGESGSGKSTLVEIIQRNIKIESGRLLLNDEINVDDLQPKDWSKCIGVVSHKIHIFNSSLIENIAFDDAEKEIKKVCDFLEAFGFRNYFEKMNLNLFTTLGESGINLSGGQKQVLALARILYHKPRLLILDECTSAMDSYSENFVLNTLRNIQNEVGILFITHRLNILPSLGSTIYILNQGIISDKGKHEELITRENFYSNYWKDLNESILKLNNLGVK